MKTLFTAFLALLLGLAFWPDDASAARLGGGRSLGAQRSVVTPRQATAPTQQRAAQPQQGSQANAAPQPATGNRWLGPLAGLAAGLGLGWLLGHGGLGDLMGAVLIAALVGIAIMLLLKFLGRGRTPSAQPLQYAGFGNETVAAPPPSQLPTADPAPSASYGADPGPLVPAGFDVEGFLKQAKLNFLRLQAANDRGDVDAIRDVTTEEMLQTLKDDIVARPAKQHTDVTALNAWLLEVATEGGAHWASVRFSGSLREQENEAPRPFEEVWHLTKPAEGGSGWLLAGIQQVS